MECTKTGANAVYEEEQEEAPTHQVESVWTIGHVEVKDAWQIQSSRRTRWKARSHVGCESSCCRGVKGGMTEVKNFFETLGSDDGDDFDDAGEPHFDDTKGMQCQRASPTAGEWRREEYWKGGPTGCDRTSNSHARGSGPRRPHTFDADMQCEVCHVDDGGLTREAQLGERS